MEDKQGVDHLAEATGVEHAGNAAMVFVMAKPDLGEFQVGIHPSRGGDKPGAGPFAGPERGGAVMIDPPGDRERREVFREVPKAFMVAQRDLGLVVTTIVADKWQAIGSRRIGPIIAAKLT